ALAQRGAAEQYQERRRAGIDSDAVAGAEDDETAGLEGFAGDVDLTVDEIESALFMLGVERERRAGVEASVGVEDFRIGLYRRGLAVEGARYDAHALAALLDQRQLALVVMLEERLALFMLLRQRHPGLDAGDARTGRAQLGRGTLGVGDAAPGVHPVDGARVDHLRRAERVAMEELAFEQIGDGGEVDVRVWAHVETLAGFEARRAEFIPEDEGPDHALLDGRQRAAHHEIVAEVARLGSDGSNH